MTSRVWQVSFMVSFVVFVFSPVDSSGLNLADQREMWQLRASQTLVKTLLTFVVTFAACWAPVECVFLAYNLGVEVDFASPVYHICVILVGGNSCINPVLFTLMNKPFRRGIKQAFCMGGSVSAQLEDGATGAASANTES